MMPINDIASLFVRRPVFAVVLSLLVVVAGAAALLGVQVRELPDVDRPVMTVRTTFTGAAPETVDAQITSVIEAAAARVPGVTSISATSSFGSSRVVIEFSDTTDLNVAAGDVRDAVAGVQRRLPDNADAPVVVKADSDGQPIMQITATSDVLPIEELTRIVEDEVLDRLSAVEGVADVQAFGAQQQMFQVTIDPAALSSRSLTVEDLQGALEGVSLDAPAGSLEGPGLQLLVRANATVRTAEEIAATPIDRATRVGDVAEVSLGPAERTTALRTNGQRGIGIGIIRQAQSNTLNISSGIHQAVGQLNMSLPDDVELSVTSDDAVFISGAVEEVVKSLLLATGIVVAVIFLFLKSWRATFIPAVTVPVAIIGTLAGIWLAGFSINILTLLALVLAAGLVVDDAIIVLENIERRRREGMGPRAAAVLGTRQVFFAVIATTVTLATVFIPISFFPGTAGRLFSEFGFVLAIAVCLSSAVALTLCPMLASRFFARGETTAPAPEKAASRFAPGAVLDRIGAMSAAAYGWGLEKSLRAPVVFLTVIAIFAAGTYGLFRSLPEELTPREDRGVIIAMVRAPQGASLEYTEGKVAEVEAVARSLVESGEATDIFSIVGRGQVNSAFVTIPLVHWNERARSQDEIAAELDRGLSRIVGVQVSSRMPNSLGIRGGGEGLQFAVTGSNYEAIAAAADDLVAEMEARLPGLTTPMVSFDTTQPQLSVEVDRERASDLGIAPASISTVIQTMLDGREIGDVFVDDEAIPLQLRAPEGTVRDPSDLRNLFVRGTDGVLVPLAAFVSVEEIAVAPSLRREAQMRSVPVRAGLAEDYSMREAMTDIRALAGETLPGGMGITFTGEAATLDETSYGVALTFGFALLIVLLVLAAQFESFVSAIVIMTTVPFGLGAAVLAMWLSGGSLNIYSQIGLVMLVGLMAKNGILIVEFANQLRDRGMEVGAAIREACRVRFRPVMMTMVSTVLGGLPLILSTGPGAEAREALGWIVVGGLGISTLFTLFVTPVAFFLLAGLSSPRAAEGQRLAEELEDANRI